MADVFTIVPAVSFVIALTLAYASRSTVAGSLPDGFQTHIQKYLIAWTLCIAGEWFCGPGVYALYSSYGFTNAQMAQLFVLGFAWSSALGTFAGGFADRFGRKRSVLLFCVLGVLSAACKHVASYHVLLAGRFLDGAHASLLYTAFESWLVSEHFERHRFPSQLLGHSFSLMFSVSYLVAVCCGLIAQVGVNLLPATPSVGVLHAGGWTVPFELSAICQIVAFAYVAFNWNENHGAKPKQAGLLDDTEEFVVSTRPGLVQSFFNGRTLLCCLLVSCFESSMFIFVFSWTPVLSPGEDHSHLPCGLIFATYMMACMSGAAVFTLCTKKSVHITHIMVAVTSLAASAMAIPAILGTSTSSVNANFFAFILFEFCVGAYFPASAQLKSLFVEERYRATIYNLFRTPMNCIVIAVLLWAPSVMYTFRLMCVMLSVAAVALAMFVLLNTTRATSKAEPLLVATPEVKAGGA